MEVEVPLPTGSLFFYATANPIRDDTGKVAMVLTHATDITDRKRTEEKLRENRQRLEFALQGGDLGTWDWCLQTGAVAYSGYWAQMLEYRPDEVEPTVDFFKRHIHPDDVSAVLERLTGHVEGRTPVYQSEHRLCTKSGGWLWVLDRGKIVEWDKNGRPVRISGIVADVTARKQAEEALREVEDRFQQLFDHMAGVKAMDTIHSDDREMVGSKIESILRNGSSEVVAGRVLLRGGPEFRWMLMTGRSIVIMGKPFLLGIGIDISDQRKAEEEKARLETQLQQAQKMESVGRLAGGVAHDFNNMLGVILGHTEMALEQVGPEQPLHADLEEIRKAATRSADLTRQLLAFARKQTIAPKVLDLNDTVENMLTMLRRLIGEDIRLAWLPGTDVSPVLMDPSQLDQILANLCVNARDAISGVGHLTIDTGTVVFDEAYCADHAGFVPGDYVRLAVSDDGCGMDPETLAQIFEPFFTTKTFGQGTGLGLATVYGIVKQNQGFINAYSEPGHGTTFTIYLPRHVGKTEHVQTGGALEPATRGHETILLVEDEPAILTLTTRMLERQGYTVLAASTPGEAMRVARDYDGEIHLLMTDVVMPEMNGRDLARNVLVLYPDMKRLFMSGYTANVIAHHGHLEDGVHFIQKPFSIKDLAAKVRGALDRA